MLYNVRIMDFQNLQTFATVISEGSMTAAANKLAITQPAVSQQIRQLEKDLGVKLLSRSSRKIKLTIQGQIFYESSNKILNLIQKTRQSIKALSLNLSGETIHISTVNSIGLHLFSPIINNFLRLNNKMRLSLTYCTGKDVVPMMQKGDVDAVIIPDLRQEYGCDFPQFKKTFLFKDSLHLAVSGRDQSMPKNMTLKDLENVRLIHLKNHYLAFHNMFQRKIREEKLSIEPSFECDNVGTVKRVIESGLGCGFLPTHSIHKQLRLKRMRSINLKDFDYSLDVNFYHKPNPQKDKILEILIRLLQQQAQGFLF